jgi:hypothetical protein
VLATPTANPTFRPVVATYYFYWYDAETGSHLNGAPGTPEALRYHFPSSPAPDWRSLAWHEKQLSDMADAGINLVLPVYWGHKEDWSDGGLPVIVAAREALVAQGKPVPAIGLFLDTSMLPEVHISDLRPVANQAVFYELIHHFYSVIPRQDWDLYAGRPFVWLYGSTTVTYFNQSLFDYIYQHFQADFGVRPLIVREAGWDCPKSTGFLGTVHYDCTHRIHTDGSYPWGAAARGFKTYGNVAEIGPGYDDSLLGRPITTVVDRANGEFYRRNFEAAIAAHRVAIAIETWDEMHEGTAICQTVEFGRQYIDLTRTLVDQYMASWGVR